MIKNRIQMFFNSIRFRICWLFTKKEIKQEFLNNFYEYFSSDKFWRSLELYDK